jgi:hypothetical protein
MAPGFNAAFAETKRPAILSFSLCTILPADHRQSWVLAHGSGASGSVAPIMAGSLSPRAFLKLRSSRWRFAPTRLFALRLARRASDADWPPYRAQREVNLMCCIRCGGAVDVTPRRSTFSA